MANKFRGGAAAGQTDYTIGIELRLTSNNLEATGKGPGDVTASYWRQGGLRTAITPTSLGSVNAAHSDGGFIEVDSANMPGLYRFDLPDAIFATGADWAFVTVKVAGCYVFQYRFNLTTDSLQTGDAFAAIGTAQTDIDDIQARLPATLDSGRIRAVTEAISNGIVTESTITGGFLDAITADVVGETLPELSQAQPPATPTVKQALMLLYMAFRNEGVSSTSVLEIKNDAGDVIAKANLSEASSIFTRTKLAAGP